MLLLTLQSVFYLSQAVLYGKLAEITDIESSALLLINYTTRSGEETVLCGGVVTSYGTILTSQHCLNVNGQKPSQIIASVGNYDRYSQHPQKTQFIAHSIVDVPQRGHEINDDLAVIMVSPSFCKQLQSQGVPFPMKASLTDIELEQTTCFASGWGITEKNAFSRFPLTAYFRLEYQNHGYSRPVLVGSYLSSQIRFCQGDSGSPVFCWRRGARFLVGLLSEIGGDVTPLKNVTIAEKCSFQDYVLVTDLRHKENDLMTATFSRSHCPTVH